MLAYFESVHPFALGDASRGPRGPSMINVFNGLSFLDLNPCNRSLWIYDFREPLAAQVQAAWLRKSGYQCYQREQVSKPS